MILRELMRLLLECDPSSEILIRTDWIIQNKKVTIESNDIKDIITATGEYPKKYTILNCEFKDK